MVSPPSATESLRRLLVHGVLVGLSSGWCASAWAQPASSEADRLFREGRELMEKGALDEACPRFAQSQALDPNTATLLNLAHCYERDAQWTRSWVTYRTAGRLALSQGRQERLETAMRRASALLEGRATLTLVADEAIHALTVRLDDIDLASEDLGVPLPITTGVHRVVATAEGKLPWRGEVKVEAGASVVMTMTPWTEAPEPAPTPEPPAIQPSGLPSTLPLMPLPRSPMLSEEPPSWWTSQRIAATTLGGLGLSAAIVASAFGGRTLTLKDDIDAACPTRDTCSEMGISLNDEAHRFALGSTVLFVAGGALAATSIVLFATSEDATVAAGPRPGGAELAWQLSWD